MMDVNKKQQVHKVLTLLATYRGRVAGTLSAPRIIELALKLVF